MPKSAAWWAGWRFGRANANASFIDTGPPEKVFHAASCTYLKGKGFNLERKVAAQRDYKAGAQAGYEGKPAEVASAKA